MSGCSLLLAALPVHAADEPDAEKKPSFMHRFFGGGEKKEEEKAPPPEPEPKKSSKGKSSSPDSPKAKARPKETDNDKPSGKPKSKITLTPKGDGSPPSKPKDSEPAKVKADAEKKTTAKKTPASAKKDIAQDGAPAKAEGKSAKERELDSEFGKTTEDGPAKPVNLNDKFKPSNTEAGTPPPALPPPDFTGALPPIDSAFEIVKNEGRDYVTAESMHRFYRFSSYKVDGNHVILSNPTLILKADIGSQEMLMNNIKFILSYPLATVNGKPAFSRLDLCKLIDPVLLPSHISDSDPFDTVVVDAGHGGHDSGAKGVYGYEKDFTLEIAMAVKAALIQRGIKVVMTRSTDEFISLGGRAEIANATPHSIFLSLHFNSSGPAANGIETFALSPQGSASTFMGQRSSDFQAYTGNHRDSANIALATAVHAMVIHRFKLVDRGIKRARWSVLTGCNRPGILFEGGFVTNGTECRLIASPTYRQAVAGAIADAIVNYRRALQPRMAMPSAKGQ
ncbi:MAG: N-acetylmuramoyl-L-alanine amidase [Verrucomicrobiaceae bacterium]|nr:N-acetylmuramoyl-L-alanine amidase [Verrucomicrobiaceae bacterium]